ncbi:glycosyltransferase family 39 protein [Actinocorallia populi]|uniref:glycosyltransferase family 39 protein n=1 Tax=Actinocorallia populi TaxID=2079200 RepID=UPI001300376D|nr:glycosyltransferase family 39 protein [Actinocorallia populi]
MSRNRLMPTVPALAALATGLWGLTGPSFWRDEAVTAEVSRRSLGQILRLLPQVDAVHGLYYLLLHLVSELFGSGEAALRLPSVLAGAVTAGCTAELGRRYGGARLGLLAGLLAAFSPFLTRYAQDARPYALVTAAAAASTLLLASALERGGRPRWAAYAVSVVLVGLFNLFALLLLAAHAFPARPRQRAWAAAAGAALGCLSPLLLLASTQRGAQISWLTRPEPQAVAEWAVVLAGGAWLVPPFAALAVLGAWRRPVLRTAAVPWLLLPVVVLLGASLISPVYTPRYVLFTAPAAALLVAAGLDSLPAVPAWAGAAALIAGMAPMHLQQHAVDDRADDLRRLRALVERHARPGDGLLFRVTEQRTIMGAYPEAFARLDDLALERTGAEAGDLTGDLAGPAAFARRLAKADRVWVVSKRPDRDSPAYPVDESRFLVLRESFGKVRGWRFKGGYLALYARE